jgi:carbamoyl-phosphate synthase large subunit
MGFRILATHGTAVALTRNGIEAELVYSLGKGRPTIFDYMKNDEVDLIINTPTGRGSKSDEDMIRKTAIIQDIPCITTVHGASTAVDGIDALIDARRRREGMAVKSLQEYY